MRSQDFMNQDDKRAKAIAALQERCDVLNLSYNYTEKQFTIDLPKPETVVMHSNDATKRTRKKFDTSTWGPIVADVNLPTELPLAEGPLTEGETPEGYDEDEHLEDK